MAIESIQGAVEHPLIGLAATVAIYAVATRLHAAFGRPAILTPVFVAVILLGLLLTIADASYERYFASAGILHAMLPAAFGLLTVAIWRQSRAIGRDLPVLMGLVFFGALAGVGSAALPTILLDGPRTLLNTLSVRTITTPVAVPLSEGLGGIASVAAFAVIASAVVGATLGPAVLRRCGVRDDRAIGLALGVAAHALGTAQALRISERAGAFAVVGMVMNAAFGSLILVFGLDRL